jgi:chromosome segregation ATPase
MARGADENDRERSGTATPSDAARVASAHPEGGLLDSRPEQGTWVSDELQQALVRVTSLGREIQMLETALHLQQEEVARLSDSVQIVEGRTSRHEVGQEQTREVRHEIAELEDRLAQEVSLRRDLTAQVERAQRREAETQQELQRVLQLISSRLDAFDGRVAADRQRDAGVRDDLAAADQQDEDIEERLERLERRVGAEFEASRHQGTETARLAASVSQILSAVDAIEARARAMQQDQRRLDEDVAALRSIRDREEELLEVVEQQRATRARLEDRVSVAEETMEELRRDLATASEERALLARQVAGESEQRRALGERVEAQRDTVADHFRRISRADEESHRRKIEEMERDIRVARTLLARLSEQTDESEQEQPL